MVPSLTSIVTASPSPSESPRSPGPDSQKRRGSSGGSLSLLSPMTIGLDDNTPTKSSSSSSQEDHTFRQPLPSDSRCPCPALNTLANHGYLPRDGKNITISALVNALKHPETYNLSSELANLLAKGGAVLAEDSLQSLLPTLFDGNKIVELHGLGLHGRVEHDASNVHKNAAPNQKFAPIRTDTLLLNEFLADRPVIELADIAHRRVALERACQLDDFHAEIARGEWALVLDVFGHRNGGKIPVDALRVWLYDNKFPEEWMPDHEQGLLDTVMTSRRIRKEMQRIREQGPGAGWTKEEDERLAQLLTSDPEEVEA